MKTEIWKDIHGYEGRYQVSNLGNVKSLNCRNTGKDYLLKLIKNYKGYIEVYLYINNMHKRFRVHRLVAQAFIPNIDNKPQVNHINGIRNDNNVYNLEWCTGSENVIHSFKVLGRQSSSKGKFGKDSNKNKPILQYTKCGFLVKKWDAMNDVERTLGIDQGHISQVCRGIRKTTGGFVWKFA